MKCVKLQQRKKAGKEEKHTMGLNSIFEREKEN
jgi:hypothetical protein